MLALLKGEKEVISITFLTLMFLKAMMLKKKMGPPPACYPRLCLRPPVAALYKALPKTAYPGTLQVPKVTEKPQIQPFFNQLMTRNCVGRPQNYSATLFLFVFMVQVFYSFKLLVLYSFVLEKQN